MMEFFKNSEFLDYLVIKQFDHIRGNWELTWIDEDSMYLEEEDSFAKELNILFNHFETFSPSENYHDFEDLLVEYAKNKNKYEIEKLGKKWIGMDYPFLLEQGGFGDIDEEKLTKSALGRIYAAINRGQKHFDEMEESHQLMLGNLIAIILYHKI